jgi:hypothetical protein
MQAPAARRSKRAKLDPRAPHDAALRAAERAAERLRYTGHPDLEEHVLRQQIEKIKDDHTIETTDEYELITRRFNEISKYTAKKQEVDLLSKTYQYQLAQKELTAKDDTEDMPKTKGFACGICLEEKSLSTARFVVPCGHAFCAGCIGAHKEDNRTRDPGHAEKGCPICRGPMTSVLKPRF